MRTTIEITAEQRSKLLYLAAMRGRKGFSELVREALDEYLATRLAADDPTVRALAMKGSLDEDDAEALEQNAARLRGSWR